MMKFAHDQRLHVKIHLSLIGGKFRKCFYSNLQIVRLPFDIIQTAFVNFPKSALS